MHEYELNYYELKANKAILIFLLVSIISFTNFDLLLVTYTFKSIIFIFILCKQLTQLKYQLLA